MTGDRVDEEKRATLRRFAALGTAGSIAGLAEADAEAPDDDGGADTRAAVVGYLAATPGAHLSKVRDDLRLGTGETQYHLRHLVDAGRIERYPDGDYRRYFPAGRFDAFERTALGYLRRETPRGMLVELLRDPAATAADLADRLGVSRPAVSDHAADMEAAGLLSRTDGYAVGRPETVLTLVVRYAGSFDDRAIALAREADGLVSYDP